MAIHKTALIILDGWGIGNQSSSDAIFHAHPSYFNHLMDEYPNSTLTTFGNAVGLPKGQMGNSEVGHINLGAGRVVWQMLAKINKAFENNEIITNPVFHQALAAAKGKNIHIIGLVSDGGVHSSLDQILQFIQLVTANTPSNVFVHAFLDGRDTDPKGGVEYLRQLQKVCTETGAKISSVIGRYYAMDRDKRWQRTHKAYNLLVNGVGKQSPNPISTVKEFYDAAVTDEFMDAIKVTDEKGNSLPNIADGEVVFNLNFRTDRPRQITDMLVERDFEEFNTKKINVHYVAMTGYDHTFKNINVLFEEENVSNTLGEYLSSKGIKQLRAAETEKYPHVTFFFNGGREEPFPNEYREMAASPKVATYDLQPEMSAKQLTEQVLPYFSNDTGFICLNYANADMVGHTGDYEAIRKAILAVDQCLQTMVTKGLENDWQFVIIADHGNADFAMNDDGSPNTQHSVNPVPCILVSNHTLSLKNGTLADVAPTILSLMGLPIPTEMTGELLINQ